MAIDSFVRFARRAATTDEPGGATPPRAARKLHKRTPQRHNRARHHNSRALTHAGPRPARRRAAGECEVHHGMESGRLAATKVSRLPDAC